MFRRKWMKKSLTGIIMLFTVLAVRAQDSTRVLSLADAIQLGITNSKQLALSRAKLNEAVAATREARERVLPDA
ncbi:MAG TPA: hypothetical protein PLQ65_16470, partial [Flavihumibacter sp.]|nr:hypothetical protein [Flavihumibacter sp.]